MDKIIYICLIFLLFSCSNEKVRFETLIYEQSTELPCNVNCTHVRIEVPKAINDTRLCTSINAHVLDVAKEIIYFGDMSDIDLDYPKIINSFITSFEEQQEIYPEEIIPWEASLEGKVIYQSQDLINIELSYYNYAGGVHGFSGIKSILVDKNSGNKLSTADLFNDNISKLTSIAEKKFRHENHITESDLINSTGFLFEEGKFQLAETILFSEKGITFLYNTYEISSFKEEPIELFLPFEEIKDYLHFK